MTGTVREIEEKARERRKQRLPRANAKSAASPKATPANSNNAKTPTSNQNSNTNANNGNKANPPKVEQPDTAPEIPNPNDDGSQPGVLIGDIKDGGKTPIGKTIARILLDQESAESTDNKYTPPASLGQSACKKDTCCQWYWAANTMASAFLGQNGRCNSLAREAIRLGFHDAGTWSQKLAAQGKDYGGADGSIVLAAEEMKRKDNKGLQEIVDQMWAWSSQFSVGMADLIQFAAAVAVVTCPLGPRMRVFVGRKDSLKAAPDGLLPGVNDSADKLISLFEDKTITPHMLTALLGAHTTSEQFFVDAKRAGAPQDGTPGVWDTLFYNQTLGLGPLPKEVFRFPSDVVLARDPRTADEWRSFSGTGGQKHWNEDYAFAYTRLSLLGVNNINDLKECTKVLPMARTSFKGAGELLKDQ
jgi:hypothetical protein